MDEWMDETNETNGTNETLDDQHLGWMKPMKPMVLGPLLGWMTWDETLKIEGSTWTK